jgi:hypothetical protein
MSPAKRIYEPRIFEGRVMLPEEQEQIYEEIIQFERMEYVSPPTPRLPNRASPPRTFRTNPPAHSLPLARERATDPRT